MKFKDENKQITISLDDLENIMIDMYEYGKMEANNDNSYFYTYDEAMKYLANHNIIEWDDLED